MHAWICLFFSISLCLFSPSFCEEASSCHHSWILGGGLILQFQSDVPFEITEEDIIKMSAHLPGLKKLEDMNVQPNLFIQHGYSMDEFSLSQEDNVIHLNSPWKGRLPPDFIHLLYGASRLEWLKHGICPMHAACIGNDEVGYILLVGPPGSGKTSLTLNNAIHHGYKIFSGDKTLLTFENGFLEAIAGTHTITVRNEDTKRWSCAKKVKGHIFGDRLAFQLPPNHYTEKSRVPINQIYLVDLNDGVTNQDMLSPVSAMHTLYPFFIDKQRGDVLIGNGPVILDGHVSTEIKSNLAENLSHVLQNIPVYKISGSLGNISSFIHSKLGSFCPKKKILFGICGIGSGHYHRQLPVLTHLLNQGHQIMVFTYGEALAFFHESFPKDPNLSIVAVEDPYFVGAPSGLDFASTAFSEKNKKDFNQINASAMDFATKNMGKPDLVISDYEMVAAQYAYAKNAPLVTLDQQSKYLIGDFDLDLNGTSYLDEVERLSLFFPKAVERIAVSFFNVLNTRDTNEVEVHLVSPMIRPEVLAAKGAPRSEIPSILMYITAQQLGEMPIEEWLDTIRETLPDTFECHVFLPKRMKLPSNEINLSFYHHGDQRFDQLLIGSHGIISTAGHTLLSEAMYLEKPVYALPLPLYEQQLNAQIISKGGFGINEPNLTQEGLQKFIFNLETYRKNIQSDQTFLLKEPGNRLIIDKIEQLLKTDTRP
jgi:uncharacterized protein (TIGR00661 family)